MNKVYARLENGECIQKARIRLLGIGKYSFETSMFDKPYELNINMPMFDTGKAAEKWIIGTGKWIRLDD